MGLKVRKQVKKLRIGETSGKESKTALAFGAECNRRQILKCQSDQHRVGSISLGDCTVASRSDCRRTSTACTDPQSLSPVLSFMTYLRKDE